jgi:pimeloyl-ACP methyl ester carboxylesterase
MRGLSVARASFRTPVILTVLLAFAVFATWSQSTAQTVGDGRAVIIYSHGTTRPQKVEDCNAPYNRVPPSLTVLETTGVARIIFLCSSAIDGPKQGSYIYKRADEIGKQVDALRAAGVPSHRIFLAGHSAGAWSSLMFMRSHADKVNAAILFAPACCGRRSEIDKYPVWLRQIQPAQIAQIVAGQAINALVFAYSDDAFNRPADLAFLTKAFPRSVTMVTESCGSGHNTLRSDCMLSATSKAIKNYIADRLKSAGRN